MDDHRLWQVRAFVYQHFAGTGHPPTVEGASAHLHLTREEAAEAYKQLHERHAVFLLPGTHHIQMAFPFSGVETPYRVYANGVMYFANCAWDTLGIPAALHADADMEAACAQSGESIQLRVRDGQVEGSDARVHFLVPFRDWYEDLSFT
jgi:hypothetical protein